MSNRKKVAILNPYVATRGGGEKHMGYLCQFMEEYYNYDVDIDILVYSNEVFDVNSPDFVTIEDLNEQFSLNLKNTKIRKLDLLQYVRNHKEYLENKKALEKVTKEYDLFINFMFLSKHIGKAKKNVYEVMFPPLRYRWELNKTIFHKLFGAFLDELYYRSYDVYISNSKFTNRWQSEYWGESSKNHVVYPPVFSEMRLQADMMSQKRKILL